MKQSNAKISAALQASAQDVWNVISSVDGVDKWFPSVIKTCEIRDGQRFCQTAEGINLVENILEVNHEKKVFRFSIPQQDLLPVTDIEETMIVSENENGEAKVEWSGTWKVSEENEQAMKEAFSDLWTLGLKEMESYIHSQVPTE